MKRVLVVSHAIPRFPGPGSETRAFCLSRYLRSDFDITYLLPDYGMDTYADLERLREICTVNTYSVEPKWNRIQWRVHSAFRRFDPLSAYCIWQKTPNMVRLIQPILPALEVCLQNTDWTYFDLFHVIHPHCAAILQHIPVPIPKTLDWVDDRTMVLRRELKIGASTRGFAKALELRRIELYQRWTAKQFDATFVSSEVDAGCICEQTGMARPEIIPNGVDLDYFANPEREFGVSKDIVFTGHLSYEPNIDAIHFFCENTVPIIWAALPEVRFLIVGAQPHRSLSDWARRYPNRISICGDVADVRPYLKRAAVSVVPLRNGSGTRLKILEAMAMYRPVVTTTIGCEGLGISSERHAVIRDDSEGFARAVIELLQNREKWNYIAGEGLHFVQGNYSWKAIASKMADCWQQTLETHHKSVRE